MIKTVWNFPSKLYEVVWNPVPPSQKSSVTKCIYMGVPVKIVFYEDDTCEAFGFFSSILFLALQLIPFTGEFMTYEGSYLRALFVWLFYGETDES